MSKQKDDHTAEEIDCLEAIDNLYAYLDGELRDEQTLAKFKHHLSHCRSCYTRSELEDVVSERIKISASVKSPKSLHKKLRQLLDEC